ncbi:helix-turn-helix transcriptional regulator [Pseudomonas asiatica]|uniref:S24 family peptidase n=1 Tax=Pseudomonas TaxID=286 RepID=UPI001AAEA87C|nr:helix-turn-helix transcriptional regulator [Pseudomonas asiatica]MBO2923967.1 helix-turn-helix transcriptional regulator [Pseudomonas asiatica]
MDINLIRKANLQLLIDRQFGPGKHGAKAEFARRLDKQADYISRCLYPPGKKGGKGVGEDFAREIEKEFQIPQYSMDRPGLGLDESETINIEGLPAPLAQKIKSYRNLVDVPRYDVEGSMGPGSEPPDINMVVEHMSLDANWVRQNLTYTKLENLKLISGRGDSMAPTIRSGDAVLVDAGVTTVEDDAIYFFLMRGKLQIKRIQRGLDGLTIISDNGQYPPIEVPGDREADITVLAQIIYWWTGRSF